jgi:hypothetical protein
MSIEIDPEEPLPARTDLFSALAWMVFGGAVTVGAWRMDRLENLHINKYEIPGLVPGLLGAAILVLGLGLALRAVARGALRAQTRRAQGESRARTMALVFALTLFYALGLVGTGLPFWIGTFAFVSIFIFLFDRGRQAGLNRGIPAQAALALIYGAATSAVVSLAFEYIFLVRLP